MIKSGIKFLIILTLIINHISNTLNAVNSKQKTVDEKVEINLTNITPEEDKFIVQLLKTINNPRIIYKDGQVIFYPNPNLETITNKMQIVAILMFICAITVILLPIAFILLIVELFHWSSLSEKTKAKESSIPYIILDDYGIKLKNENISWVEINNITIVQIFQTAT